MPGMASLLEPLKLGPAQVPNRIVFGAHVTNFGLHNVFTPRHLAYYRERAEGGAGLIVTEALTVHPLDWPYEHIPFGHRDEIIPSLEQLGGTLRAASPGGLRILAQLNHSGGQTHGRLLRQSPWAPSAVPDVASRKMPRVMEPGHIEQVVEGFGQAAARVARAGLDGVELNAGQYSLLRQFLSPLTNHRSDEYGGSLENRMRLLLRVSEAARRALGAGRILGIKLCGDELAPWGGLKPEDAAEIARLLAEAGAADYLSIEMGGPYSAHVTEAGMPMPMAHGAAAAGTIRAAVAGKIPVFAEGRIDSVECAVRVLEAGQADAVVMTRALISDPRLPLKIAGSDPEPIRPQVGMNRYFVVKGDWNRPLGDLANPRAGREEELPAPRPLAGSSTQRVLVVGGGPAGLEAAQTLARMGHPVTLIERRDRLGGTAALLAESVPARAEFAPLVAWHEGMLRSLGVDVRLGQAVTGEEPWLREFDRMFLATGARSPEPPFSAPEGFPVWTPRALLEPDAPSQLPDPAAGRAVVIDTEYGYRMANAVERLLALGFGVDVLSEDFFVGREIVESAELLWFSRVAAAGVGLHPRMRLTRIEPGPGRSATVIATDRFARRESRFSPAALIVYSSPEIPDDGLADRLRAIHPRVLTVGDARAPRLMGEAILHAHKTVR